jgi:hypothetical protein
VNDSRQKYLRKKNNPQNQPCGIKFHQIISISEKLPIEQPPTGQLPIENITTLVQYTVEYYQNQVIVSSQDIIID